MGEGSKGLTDEGFVIKTGYILTSLENPTSLILSFTFATKPLGRFCVTTIFLL